MSFDILPVQTTFPDTFLDLRTEIQVNSVWTDISTYLQRDPVVITRGHQDESTDTSPSQATFTLNNNDGRFSSKNPLGPFYPYLGRNTPVRISVPEGASYLRLENDNESYIQTSTIPANTGSIDIQIDATLDNWHTFGILASKWTGSSADTETTRSWMIVLNGDYIFFNWANGLTGHTFVSAPIFEGLPLTGRACLRVTLNPVTAAVNFYSAPGGSLSAPTWTLFGSGNGNIGSGVIQDPGTQPVMLGYNPNTFYTPTPGAGAYVADEVNYNGFVGAELVNWQTYGVTGKIHAFQLLNSIAGAIVANPDFTQATAGANTVADTSGNTWTCEGTSEISNRMYRFHGEMSAWPQSWGPTGQEVLISVTASGFLRRLSQQQLPEQSAMFRGYTIDPFTPTPVVYWPMEDGASALSIASGIGGSPMNWTGSPQLSSNNDFLSSAALPVLNGAFFEAQVPIAPQGTPTQVTYQFLLSIPDGGDSATGRIATMFFSNSTLNFISLNYTNTSTGTLQFTGVNQAGTTIFNTGALATEMNGTPALVSMTLTQNGSLIEANLSIQKLVGLDGSTPAGGGQFGTSCTGTLGPASLVTFNNDLALTTTAVGHAAVLNAGAPSFYFAGVLNAWLGEYAGARFQRLCIEEGIQCRVVGNLTNTAQMGIQSAETLTDLLQECVDADYGVWTEPRQCMGWGYVCQSALGNQPAAVAGDYDQEFLDGDLSPTEDDQTTVNDISLTQEFGSTSSDTGSSFRAQLLTGKMSVQAPPNGVGRYQNQVNVNLAFPQALGLLANQMLRVGSTDEPRYPGITINLATEYLQSLFYEVLDVDIAQRLTIANPPPWLPPGLIDQLIQGTKETLWLKQLEVTFNGWPMQPWNCLIFNDDTIGWFDTDGSELNAGVSSTATSLSVKTVNAGSPLWTTNGADFPFNIMVGGEEMTVTNITGSSSPQTFTVTRSVNGVTKAQTANTAVNVYPGPYFGL